MPQNRDYQKEYQGMIDSGDDPAIADKKLQRLMADDAIASGANKDLVNKLYEDKIKAINEGVVPEGKKENPADLLGNIARTAVGVVGGAAKGATDQYYTTKDI